MILGIELRTSHLLGKHHFSCDPAETLLLFVFQIGFELTLPELALNLHPPIAAS